MTQRFSPGAWTALSTRFFRDPKVVNAGRDSALLYLAGLCYSQEHLTDGVIPKGALRIIAAESFTTTKAANALVREGLWIESDTNYTVAQWSEWNRSKDEVEAQRAAANERKRAWREAKDKKRTGPVTDAARDASRDAGHDGDGTGRATRPSRSTPDLTPDLPPTPLRDATDRDPDEPPAEGGPSAKEEPHQRTHRPPWLPDAIPDPAWWPGDYDPALQHPLPPNDQPLAWTVTPDLIDHQPRPAKHAAIAAHIAQAEHARALDAGANISNRDAWLAAAARTADETHDIEAVLDQYPWAQPERLAGLLDERTGHPDGRSLHTALLANAQAIHDHHKRLHAAHIDAEKASHPDLARNGAAAARAKLNGRKAEAQEVAS